jgi:tripartite-type tricarboxylate transporter receptor subunit TctC
VVPEVPTIAEAGLAGYEAATWYGMLAPAATPAAIVSRLQKQMEEVLKSGEIKEKLLAQGLEAVANTPADFASVISAELAKWSRIVAAAGVKAE